ncbi:tetratricopeptide repeat protein, partial [bacterium]
MKIMSNKILFFSLFLIIILLLAFSFAPARFTRKFVHKTYHLMLKIDKGRLHYEQGADFLDQKKYDDCIRESEIAIKLNPRLDGAYCNMGASYLVKDDYDRALFYLAKAFRINPKREATHKNLILLFNNLQYGHIKNDQYPKILTICLKLVQIYPKDKDLRLTLGNIHHYMGSIEKAIEEYQTAVELDPKNPILYGLIGSTYVELKLYDKAIEAFKEGVKLAPNIAMMHYELGVTYYDKGLVPEAIKEIKEAVKIDPDYEMARNALKSLEGLKDSPLNIKTDSLEGELNRFLLTRKQTIQDAVPSETVFLDIYPPGEDKPNAYALPISAALDFIDHLYSNNKFEDVVIYSRQLIKSTKGKVYPYYKMAIALEALGKIDEAIKEYDNLKKLSPEFPVTYFRLWGIYKYDKGNSLLAKSNMEIFKSMFNKADEVTQKQIELTIVDDSFSIGSYHLNISRKMDRAIKEFLIILELRPSQPEIKYNLATSYLNKGI